MRPNPLQREHPMATALTSILVGNGESRDVALDDYRRAQTMAKTEELARDRELNAEIDMIVNSLSGDSQFKDRVGGLFGYETPTIATSDGIQEDMNPDGTANPTRENLVRLLARRMAESSASSVASAGDTIGSFTQERINEVLRGIKLGEEIEDLQEGGGTAKTPKSWSVNNQAKAEVKINDSLLNDTQKQLLNSQFLSLGGKSNNWIESLNKASKVNYVARSDTTGEETSLYVDYSGFDDENNYEKLGSGYFDGITEFEVHKKLLEAIMEQRPPEPQLRSILANGAGFSEEQINEILRWTTSQSQSRQ